MADFDFEELDRVIKEMSDVDVPANSEQPKTADSVEDASQTQKAVTEQIAEQQAEVSEVKIVKAKAMDVTSNKVISVISQEDAHAIIMARRKKRAAEINQRMMEERKQRQAAKLNKVKAEVEAEAELDKSVKPAEPEVVQSETPVNTAKTESEVKEPEVAPTKQSDAEPAAKAELKPEDKPEAKSEVKSEDKSEVKPETEADTKNNVASAEAKSSELKDSDVVKKSEPENTEASESATKPSDDTDENDENDENDVAARLNRRLVRYSQRLSRRALRQPRPIEEATTPLAGDSRPDEKPYESPFLEGVKVKKAPLGIKEPERKANAVAVKSEPAEVEMAPRKNQKPAPTSHNATTNSDGFIDSFINSMQMKREQQSMVESHTMPRRPKATLDNMGSAARPSRRRLGRRDDDDDNSPFDDLQVVDKRSRSAWTWIVVCLVVLIALSGAGVYLYLTGSLDHLINSLK